MLKEAEKIGCDELAHYASKHFIQNPISYGQDKENGGLFYFLDVDGKSQRSINIHIIYCHFIYVSWSTNDIELPISNEHMQLHKLC